MTDSDPSPIKLMLFRVESHELSSSLLRDSLPLSVYHRGRLGRASIRMKGMPATADSVVPLSWPVISENPVISYEYRPGRTPGDRPFDESHRGFAMNSVGFRDSAYVETKPAETHRTIVVGDSTTAGNGVPNPDNIYTKQLEKLLNMHNTTGIHYMVCDAAPRPSASDAAPLRQTGRSDGPVWHGNVALARFSGRHRR